MPHFAATVREDRSLELPFDARALVQPGQIVGVELPEHIDDEFGPRFADLIHEYIGCVSGSGTNNSENTGEKFTDYLVEKHR